MEEPQNQTPPSDVPQAAAEPTELDKAQTLAADNMAGWQRAMADYANLKREAEQKLADIGKYGNASFVEKLIPVVESLRKAAESRPAEGFDERAAKWADGIGLIRGQLDTMLASAGVTAIADANVPFDPTLHEAMMNEPATDGIASGTVTKVLEPGWKMYDRVIRPAKVTVAE